jgi:hypothetical protein
MMRFFLLFTVAFSSSHAWLLPVASRKSRLTLFSGDDESFWKQRPGESNAALFKRIQQASGDAAAFEHFVTTGEGKQKAAAPDLPTVTEPKKKGYQRAEDWEAEQQAILAKEMTWEQRVQFDGQRQGNRVKQNEILRHHLNTY